MDEKQIQEQVSVVQVKPFVLETDFELFSLALKNLIDNALKYSPEHKVTVTINRDSIVIANIVKQFTNNLDEYSQPFHTRDNKLGLGLYIVQNIMKMLKLDLVYEYIDEENIFRIK